MGSRTSRPQVAALRYGEIGRDRPKANSSLNRNEMVPSSGARFHGISRSHPSPQGDDSFTSSRLDAKCGAAAPHTSVVGHQSVITDLWGSA